MIPFEGLQMKDCQTMSPQTQSIINLQVQKPQSLKMSSSHYSPSKILGLVSKMLILLLVMEMAIQGCNCQTSQPFGYQPIANIESALLGMTITGGYPGTYFYNFAKTKRSAPFYQRTFLAIQQMDYNLNTVVGGVFVLNFQLDFWIASQTNMEIYLYAPLNMVNKAKVSLIIFDNDFVIFNEAFQDLGYVDFSSSTSGSFAFTLKSPTFTALRFLTYVDVATKDNRNANINLNTGSGSTSTTYTINTNLGGSNLNYAYGQIRTLLVYPLLAKNFGYTVSATDYILNTAPFSYTFTIPNYDQKQSVVFLGLDKFDYAMTDNALNVGFQWTLTLSQDASNQMLTNTAVDDQYKMFVYSHLIISMIRCPVGYDLRATNRTTSVLECFDICHSNEYIDYDATNKYLICVVCPNPLCKTCENPTQCSSCVDGYNLVETTQTCTPVTGFYLDPSNVLRPCSYAIVGCKNCSANANTCSSCQDGYYLLGNSCDSCSAKYPDCSKCNDTSCLDCTLPKVLINGTLCSNPMGSQQIITPSSPRGPCTDPNCFQCSATNTSDCIVCKSNLYILQNGKCNTVCGDGLIDGTDVCDDSNHIDFDGCSADCKTLEQGFVCSRIPAQLAGYQATSCYFGKVINLSVVSIEKPLIQNKVNLYFNNPEPKIAAWQQIDLNNELTQAFTLRIPRFDSGVPGYFFNFTASFVKSPELISKLRARTKNLSPEKLYSQTSRLLQSTFSAENYQFIMLEIVYSPDAPGSVPLPGIDKESLNHQTMTVAFDPKLSQRSIFTKGASPLSFSSSFTLKADDNQVIQFYDESYYERVSQIEGLSMVIGICCLLLMVIGLVSFCVDGRNSKQMLVAVETAFVVQLTYFSLLGVGEINPLLLSMASGLKYSAGFDPNMDEEGQQTVRYLLGIDVNSVGMASNVNVSFILVLLCMLAGGIMLLLDKFVFSKKKQEIHLQNQRNSTNQDGGLLQDQFKSQRNSNKGDQNKSQKSQKENQNQTIDKKDEIEKSENNEKDELNKKTKQKKQEQSRCHRFGMFMVFNAGFGFFLFYLYKWAFFTCVQLKYGMQDILGTNIIILGGFIFILIIFVVFLIKKLDMFDSFALKLTGRRYKINTFDTLVKNKEIPTDKIKKIQKKFAVYIENLPIDEKPQILRNNSLQGPSINIKLWYFVVIIIEHFVNMGVIVFMSSSFEYVNMIPMATYIINFILLYKVPVYPSSNLYRLYSAQIVGMIIQAIFLTRRILSVNITAESAVGQEENSLSMYFTISVVILLFLLCLEAFAFSFYGIRRIRCCELQMDWQKIEMNHNLKQKLQKFVIQELTENFNAKINQGPGQHNIDQNGDQIDGQDDGDYDNHPFMNNNSSFDSSDDQQYFNSPSKLNKFKKDKDNVSMAQSPAFKGRKLMKKPMKNMIDFDRPINQQITTQLLKKQIKEKLLNSRLETKIKRMGGFDDAKSHSSKKGYDSSRSQGRANNSMLVSSDSRNKVLVTNVTEEKVKNPSANSKKIKEVDFMNSILLKNEALTNQKVNEEEFHEIGYVYTDKKGYDVYEEFDII